MPKQPIAFASIEQFPTAHYEVNVAWEDLEGWLAKRNKEEHSRLVLDPDYQRFHVWHSGQQREYVEFVLRGGESGRVLFWNHPNWMGSFQGDLELVDGKQRLEAVRAFLRDEVPVFGGHLFSDFDRIGFNVDFKMRIAKLPTRKHVLKWYLMINAGGTPHSEEELFRVRKLLEAEG